MKIKSGYIFIYKHSAHSNIHNFLRKKRKEKKNPHWSLSNRKSDINTRVIVHLQPSVSFADAVTVRCVHYASINRSLISRPASSVFTTEWHIFRLHVELSLLGRKVGEGDYRALSGKTIFFFIVKLLFPVIVKSPSSPPLSLTPSFPFPSTSLFLFFSLSSS